MTIAIPPNSPDAEMAVIGSVMQTPAFYGDVSLYVNETTLYDQTNKHVWQIIRNLMENGKTVDFVTLSSALTKEDKEKYVTAYTLSLYSDNATSSVDRVTIYAKEVYEKYLMRLAIKHAGDLTRTAYNNPSNLYSVLNSANATINELIAMLPSHPFDMGDELDKTIITLGNEESNLIPVGFDSVDALAGGMTRGEVTVIGGRPGHGKTTFSLNIASNLVSSGYKVLMINREMTNMEMLKKLIVLESGALSYGRMRRGDLSDLNREEINRVRDSVQKKFNSERFMMCDNIFDMASAVNVINRFKPDVIIDDYIQLIRPDNPSDQRRFQIENIVHQYKRLAKSINCSAILVSQLSRALEARGQGARPILSDLAESGTIEQVAENVWFTYYDYKVFMGHSKSGQNEIEVICAKVRYGTSGVSHCGYDGDRVKFYDSIDSYRSTLF